MYSFDRPGKKLFEGIGSSGRDLLKGITEMKSTSSIVDLLRPDVLFGPVGKKLYHFSFFHQERFSVG